MAMIESLDPDAYTPVMVDNDGLVRDIGGKPEAEGGNKADGRTGGFSLFHFAGLSILEPELVDYLPDDSFATMVSEGLVPAINDGKKIKAWTCRGYWKALDDMEKIKEAEADMKKGRFRPAAVGP